MIRRFLDWLFRSDPAPIAVVPGPMLMLGGRLIDMKDWSPDVVEQLKKEFFMPALKNAYLMRVDLTAGCSEGHITTDRVGVFSSKGDLTKKVADDLHRIRLTITCKHCGKPARISGRRVAWQGDLGVWDGAT